MAFLLSRTSAVSLLLRTSTLNLSKSSLKTTAPKLSSEARTPIQRWGLSYLNRQDALKRPISPHLGIYQPQLTWYLSGAHRISGSIMGGAVVVIAIGLAVAPFDFPQLIEWIRSLGLPPVLVYAVKWWIAFPVLFHMLNGIRFLGFDMAKGMNLRTVYTGGYLVMGFALGLATLIALMRSSA